jgi:hypothetical protein
VVVLEKQEGFRKMGRKKGVGNKKTETARRAIANFVEGNVGNLNKWLAQMAKDDPEAAFKALMSVVEYHIPKLARTEVTGADGSKLEIEHILTTLGGSSEKKSLPVPNDSGIIEVQAIAEEGSMLSTDDAERQQEDGKPRETH